MAARYESGRIARSLQDRPAPAARRRRRRRLRRLGSRVSRASAARLGAGDAGDAVQVRLARRGERCRAFRTGSSTCCRGCFPRSCRAPAATPRSAFRGKQGQELPVGFTKKTIGFPRVANNCAVCHTATYRTRPDETPVFVVASPGHTTNVEGFFRFLIDCAKDPRFNADNLMSEINLVTKLDLIDKMLYRFFVIPDHQEAPDRARSPVRLDLPQGFSRLGPRPRRRDEPHQVLHGEAADGRHVRSDRHAFDLEPPEVPGGPGHVHELRRRQPRRVLGDHGFRARPARRRACAQAGLPRPGGVAARIPDQAAGAEVSVSHRCRAARRPARRSSRRIAPRATRARGRERASRSPKSAPTATASIPGTRTRRWSRTRS